MSLPASLTFPEEPLLLTAADGYGFFPAHPGVTLDHGRYVIIRKLGWGQYSSTWLVRDTRPESPTLKYHAAKVLTADATRRHKEGQLRELEILQAVKQLDDMDYLPILRGHFEHTGPHGDHICFLLNVLSTDVSSFRRSAPTKVLPLYMVKIIVAEVVEALEQLHRLNIIHTDLKPDNLLFLGVDTAAIDRKLSEDEPPVMIGEFDLHAKQYSILRSQPLTHDFKYDTRPFIAELLSVTLTDLGHAQWANKDPTTVEVGSYALRAPEVILGARFDTKVDIWALGCMTFELLTGRWAFHPEAGEEWRLEDDHLAKMMELIGETFRPKMIAQSRHGKDYFDEAGNLRRINELYPVSLEEALKNYKLAAEDIPPAAAFIRACLRLDPEDRASADELQLHDWVLETVRALDVTGGHAQVDLSSDSNSYIRHIGNDWEASKKSVDVLDPAVEGESSRTGLNSV